MFADLAFVHGNIVTMNSSQQIAEAIAIKKDKIIKVGTNEEINHYIRKTTKVIDLQQKTIFPGFIDSHIHVADLGKFLTWINLKNVNSIEEMQKKIRKRAQDIPKGRWIIGNGWDQTRFIEKRYPNLRDLDKVSSDHPVVLYHNCECVSVVNSKALELAAVTKKTLAPSGGEIKKDPETGNLTGILSENATDVVWKKIPEPSEEELIETTSQACKKIVEAGVTSVHWIVSSLTEISIIKRLGEENKLPLRIHVIAPVNIMDQIDNFDSLLGSGDKTAKMLGIKVFVDGSLAARTAALNEPYTDNSATKGELLYSQEELNKLVAKVHKTKFRLVMHAMGDRAIAIALKAIAEVLMKRPKKDHRYRLEHASVLNKELIQQIKKLGVIISVQPKCVISEFSVWSALNRLGFKRAKLLYPLKTIIKEGIHVISGSDSPMEPLSPLLGIQAAVDREKFPEERITVDDALQMYTINAAYASSEETIKGSIEEGKLADLTVLSDDPRTVPTNKIGDIEVIATVVGGKVAYQKIN